jgi:hypothetical protein
MPAESSVKEYRKSHVSYPLFKRKASGQFIKRNYIPISINNFYKYISSSLSIKIALVLIVWTLLLYNITGENQVEIFFILVFIGFIIVRELTENHSTISIKHRLDGFIIIFFLAYAILVSEKIINILAL